MNEIADLRRELSGALEAARRWAFDDSNLDVDDDVLDEKWARDTLLTLRQLQTRASSTMINIAFVGGFSSGKSFLIGALQNRLEYEQVVDDSQDITADQYLGLLFSAPQQTTACPATVAPIGADSGFDGSERGFLRVRFTDSDAWEDVGHSPPPAVVAAYTTQIPDYTINRLSAQHRSRKVAEVEILLADADLPAKLYDLPGHGSLEPEHDQISARAWADADCFVFTTQATQTIGLAEHEVISRLYEHHLNTGKRIIWVVTGIDRANVARLTDNKVAWQETVENNNRYLRDNFKASQGQLDTFFGPDGFIAVSPAWEAQGNWRKAEGEEKSGAKMVAASRMWRLRETVVDLINSGTGRKHVSGISREARSLVAVRHTLLAELLNTARTPLERLAAERDSLDRRRRQLQDAMSTLREQLQTSLMPHTRRLERQFRGLDNYLHEHLDDRIRETDLTKEKGQHTIDSEVAQLLAQWARQHGPEEVWTEEAELFTAEVLDRVRVILGDTNPSEQFHPTATRVNLTQLRVAPSERYRSSAQDVLEQVSKVVGLATPVVSGIAVAAGLVTGPVLALPAVLTLGAAVAYGAIRRTNARATTLDILRDQRIRQLDDVATEYRAMYVAAASARANDVIARALEILDGRLTELLRQTTLADRTLAEPDNARRQRLVETLEPHCAAGHKVLSLLDKLVLR
ncbi:hypothetical protein Cme02nite_48340 [Catellatospora methionotrophica]|uniref:Dynamin family protein n=1 Tax=Catellatospora methionotrophica TaxID=121620 RepID=A0A8J3PGN6_9ACTN|nr:GTPase domain-containing protein [Catellatospora methionotrophica]GIG16502.1 hypothetical protein Cme02nite_48340 [Catellatospora methionotrophica]